jgi:hypothetical protein
VSSCCDCALKLSFWFLHVPLFGLALPARLASRRFHGRHVDRLTLPRDTALVLPLFVAVPLYAFAVICLGWEMLGDPPFNGDRLGGVALTVVLGDTLIRTFREEMRRRG